MEDHYGRESESRRRYQAGSPTQPLYTHQTLDALLQSTAGDGHEDIPQSNAYQTTGAHRRAKSRGGQEAGGQQPEIGSRLDERDMAAAISRRRAERGAAWEGDRYGGGADGARFWATVSGFYQPDWPDVRSFVEIHCGAFTDFEVEAQCNYRYLRFQSWEALEKCLRLDGANVPSTPFVLRVAPASSEMADNGVSRTDTAKDFRPGQPLGRAEIRQNSKHFVRRNVFLRLTDTAQ
eukprot:Selendium_serpulae@DN2845_c0_g1_i1.p1